MLWSEKVTMGGVVPGYRQDHCREPPFLVDSNASWLVGRRFVMQIINCKLSVRSRRANHHPFDVTEFWCRVSRANSLHLVALYLSIESSFNRPRLECAA